MKIEKYSLEIGESYIYSCNGVIKIKNRKWYNPLRFIKGKTYRLRFGCINPSPSLCRYTMTTGFGCIDVNGHILNGYGV